MEQLLGILRGGKATLAPDIRKTERPEEKINKKNTKKIKQKMLSN